MPCKHKQVFLQGLILGCLTVGCGPPPSIESESATPDPDGKRNAVPADLKPSYLPATGDATKPVPLEFGETLELRLPPGQALPKPLGVAFTDSRVCVFQRSRKAALWYFDYGGNRLGKVEGPARLPVGAELAVGPDGKRVFLTDPAKSLSEYDSRFRLLRRLEGLELSDVSGVAGGGDEAPILSLFPEFGYYLGIVKEDGSIHRFHAERTPSGKSPESYRCNLLPFVYTDVDSAGNIYSVEHVKYEIRKYDRLGRYSGDFKIQSDAGSYLPPPGGVDKLRLQLDPGFRKEWSSSWTAVQQALVANDRYLVVSLGPDREGAFRLHFYTLEGSPAFSPLTVTGRLIGRDGGGHLYFLESKDSESLRLRVCTVGKG